MEQVVLFWDVHIFLLPYMDDFILIATSEHDPELQMNLLGQNPDEFRM